MLDLPHPASAKLRPSRRRAQPALVRRLYNALGAPRPERADLLSTVELLEREPLASAGEFPGDLLRRLIDLPAGIWTRETDLHSRYREVVRAAALARRELPEKERGAFWSSLPDRL